MNKTFIVVVISCLIANITFAQKIIKTKVRKDNQPFTLAIDGKDYQAYIKEYLLTHKNYKIWQKRSQDSCKKNSEKSELVSKIKILVSFSYDGKVWVSDHYSTPNEFDYVDDNDLQKWVTEISKELIQKIKKKGIIHPPFKDGKYYNDEVVVEYLWRYNCKSPK
jgi:hypothetical protein